MASTDPEDQARLELLGELGRRGYRFITPTPETHRRVVSRPANQQARDLADIFGWSLPFAPDLLDPPLFALMNSAGLVAPRGNLLFSTHRVSSLGDMLFLHSAWPTAEANAVFFGPDTYRFARFLRQELGGCRKPIQRLVDIGCGSGAGALLAARLTGAPDVVMADINPAALRLASVNARAASVPASVVQSDVMQDLDGEFDLIVSNPPYLVDEAARTYRHGGAMKGAALSLRIARDAAARLADGGLLLLYTASAIEGGCDSFRDAVVPMLHDAGCQATYEEIDPDVWGEELERAPYDAVDRIAVVSVKAVKEARQ